MRRCCAPCAGGVGGLGVVAVVPALVDTAAVEVFGEAEGGSSCLEHCVAELGGVERFDQLMS